MWDTLKDRTNARLEALDRAREIHAFNRNVEDTRAWIQEKEAALMFFDDGARDLSGVQALQRKHQGFQVSKSFSYSRWLSFGKACIPCNSSREAL